MVGAAVRPQEPQAALCHGGRREAVPTPHIPQRCVDCTISQGGSKHGGRVVAALEGGAGGEGAGVAPARAEEGSF